MAKGPLHLVKLCVGTDSPDDLLRWRVARADAARAAGLDWRPSHVTRMWPKRADELLDGGSLYWVFKGVILARQRILGLEEVFGSDGIRRCEIIFDPDLVLTEAAPRRAFQGWRYLKPEDAPRDLPKRRDGDSDLPEELDRALSDLGLR
ncbi:DUF1489 family protein [Oceanomicrobium pacificus]|uniref:DUF1489 family protein n=1 Tax=Oceanomicrobium pacificus TaxID=2692916 RepID=A0A6B0TU40_9RHOB|nr:DUF1489 domain-containing protein [Oceanomicrobium pacificus]MXU65295.1 DUF1489 family protein [Oceanomicrobium pacificus]